ncbi:MAG: bifunctional enoyl-CoA hydratase/phosphate acetyltransferase [Bacteroidales bacterium]|jgi:phosphate butyryltransferase
MFNRIIELEGMLESRKNRRKLVLAVAQDSHALDAVCKAAKKGFIEPVLVGNLKLIKQLAEEGDILLDGCTIIDETDTLKAVEMAVRLVHDGSADILMKGGCTTSQLLKGVLNREWGLRNGELLSHFALFEIPAYHKLLGITDVAINIAPDLNDKIAIVNNAVDFMNRLGLAMPKIAAVAAVETVNEQMPATMDAAKLSALNREGAIRNCLIEGPLAFDTAISKESAIHKNLVSEVAGEADLLLMPDIEAGNILYKALAYFANSKVASVILGASAPVVLTSRSDSEEAKLNSILLASAVNN